MTRSNPARELHTLFTSWNRGAAASQSRGVGSPADLFAVHEDAMRNVIELRNIIAAYGATSSIIARASEHIPAAVSAILAFRTGFQSQGADSQNINTLMLNSLDFIAFEIDRIGNELASKHEILEDVFSPIRDLLVEDDTASPELKAFIQTLMTDIRHHLESSSLGLGFDLDNAMKQLWVALVAIQNSSHQKGKWSDFAARIKSVGSGLLNRGPQWLSLPGAVDTTMKMLGQ